MKPMTVTCLGGQHRHCENEAQCECVCHKAAAAPRPKNPALNYSEGLKLAISAGRVNDFVRQLEHLNALWELVSKPIKFPDRRRREDRQIPKAA